MSREEMLMRLGYYIGFAMRELGDGSYADWLQRKWGRAETITEDEYVVMASRIHADLVAAGKIRPDEDPFELELLEFLTK